MQQAFAADTVYVLSATVHRQLQLPVHELLMPFKTACRNAVHKNILDVKADLAC